MVDWSTLPIELLELIANKLHFVEDYLSFVKVCKSWGRVIVQNGSSSVSFLPCLMLTQKMDTDMRAVCYPYRNNNFKLHLPEVRDKRCWGSSYGWLVTLGCDFKMHLLNPLSGVNMLLPELHKCQNLNNLIFTPKRFRDSFVNKVVLSSSPLSSDCVVLAIFDDQEKMAIIKRGDDTWTSLGCSLASIDDVIIFGQNVYVISSYGDVVICDLKGNILKKRFFTPLLGEVLNPKYDASYLVELGGNIYVISRLMYVQIDNDTPFHTFIRTCHFNVYKLDVCNEEWTEVQRLGDWSIFIGNNNSFSICSTDYPECISNCVYFTNDYLEMSHNTSASYDIGIYSLETRMIQPFAQEDISFFKFSIPIWFKPSFL